MNKLVGNRTAREILGRFIAAGRVPNALLFAGPDGVGKKQFAIELAKRLVCTAEDGAAACGKCAACRRADVFEIPTFSKGEETERVFFGQHPDVGLVVPYNRVLRIGAIRALEREANFRPYEANARIFIIEDADKMNDASANALLKTLEEPPETSHIILIASRADSLLATIRSRCQTIRFAPVEPAEIEKHLIETGDFSPEDASLAAHVSGGSVGRARQIVPASFRTQRSLMLDVVKAAISGSRGELLRISEEMSDARNKEYLDENLQILEGLIHDVWLLTNDGPVASIINADIRPELEKLAAQAKADVLSDWLRDLELLQENFIVNINRRVATDALFVGMAA
jgi:DNA polymerase III subunit delta'